MPIPAAVFDFGAALLPRENQCVLSSMHGLFRLTKDQHYLWIDNLYLHSAPRGTREFGQEHRLLDIDGDESRIWITQTTLQGDAQYSEAVMLWSETAAVHFESMLAPL